MDTTNNDITLEFSFTLIQDYANGFELATSPEFAAAIGFGTVANPIPNPCPTPDPTISDRFTCAVATTLTTDAGGCPSPVPCSVADEVSRFQSGIAFDGEGILITAVATSPDEFKMVFPAIKYIDVNTSPALPYAPTYYAYEYFKLIEPQVIFRALAVPSSLHSNRGYEVGLVYMDEFNRSTSALVSELNTVHIPCRFSTWQNKIKVTIPITQEAPTWATRYKFVLKPDTIGYNTIYSNIVFTDTITNSKYVLLEGENTRKVNEGDDLIVKADKSGALTNCLTVTALEVKAQEEDFIIPVETGITAFAGVYMKLK